MRYKWAMLFSAWWGAVIPSIGLAQEAEVEQAMRRGTALFWYDRAAWVTSDDLVARLPRDRRAEIGGWIVVAAARGYHVFYHGKGDAADTVIYEADVVGNSVSNAKVYPKTDAPELPAPALAMATALRTAWREMASHPDWQPCTPSHFNTVVLPPEADGSVPVYFLSPQTVTDSFPFGGHFEIVISAAGKAISSRRFTNSCLTIDKAPASSGNEPMGMYLTHLLDTHPTEIHVFQQYAIGVPLYVGVQPTHAIWKVENGEMALTDPSK